MPTTMPSAPSLYPFRARDPHTTALSDGTYYLYGSNQLPSLRVIAHSLSQVCRFGGHTHRFYSVLEHSYYVALAYLMMYPHCQKLEARMALLHDAHECVVGDVQSPLRRYVTRMGHQCQIKEVTVAFDHALWAAETGKSYAELYPLREFIEPRIKAADEAVLSWEAYNLLPDSSWFPPPPPGLDDAITRARVEWGGPPSTEQIRREFESFYRHLDGKRAWTQAFEHGQPKAAPLT